MGEVCDNANAMVLYVVANPGLVQAIRVIVPSLLSRILEPRHSI